MTKEELFRAAFGGSSPVFLTIPLGAKNQPEINGYQPKLKAKEDTGSHKVYSDFGTEVVYPIWFEAGDYWGRKDSLARFGSSEEEKIKARVKMAEFRLPNATMVDFSRGKIMTQTNVLEGTVNEIYGFDDWKIRIRMICLAERNRSMTGQQIANEIVKWSDLADHINVIGTQFTEKDIYSLVIDSIDIKSIEGSPDTVGIELMCSSYDPFELIHNPKKEEFHNDKKTADFITMINNLNIDKP